MKKPKKTSEKRVARAVAVRMIEEAKRILIACEVEGKAINMLSFAESGIKQAIRRQQDEDITRS